MTTLRTFIAIELSDQAQAALLQLQSRLKPLVPPHSVRWTAPQNIHLTLHFLGDVYTESVEQVGAMLPQVTATYHPFSLKLAQLGCFPNTQRPQIIWVGVTGDMKLLENLHRDLGYALKSAIDFSPETRPYAPHLTIGRVKKGIPSRHLRQLSQTLEQEQPKIGRLVDLQVTEIHLIKSELKPAGAVYTSLNRGKLGDD